MNVIWIQTDEQRVDSLGCYGSKWAKTPNIDRLAKEGTVFENAYCQAPVCVPSRSSQVWVDYPQAIGCLHNRALSFSPPDGHKSLPEALKDSGYCTASFGKRHIMGHEVWQHDDVFVIEEKHIGFYGLPEGFDEAEHRVIKRPGGAPIILAGRYPDVKDNPATHVTDRALEFIRSMDRSHPFFIRVNHLFPHTPVLPPDPWGDTYQAQELPIRRFDKAQREGRPEYDRKKALQDRMDKLSESQVVQMWRDYMGLCSYVDHEVGRLLAGLKNLDVLDDTLIVYSTDHGKSLGEWGVGEKDTFDDCVWRVPFICWRPGLVPQGERRNGICEQVDLARTLFGCLGLQNSVPDLWVGRDLFTEGEGGVAFGAIRPEWAYADETEPHFRAAVRHASYRMDVTLPFSLNMSDKDLLDGGLYDLGSDPEEKTNLFKEERMQHIVEDLLSRLNRWLQEHPLDSRLHDKSLLGSLY